MRSLLLMDDTSGRESSSSSFETTTWSVHPFSNRVMTSGSIKKNHQTFSAHKRRISREQKGKKKVQLNFLRIHLRPTCRHWKPITHKRAKMAQFSLRTLQRSYNERAICYVNLRIVQCYDGRERERKGNVKFEFDHKCLGINGLLSIDSVVIVAFNSRCVSIGQFNWSFHLRPQ